MQFAFHFGFVNRQGSPSSEPLVVTPDNGPAQRLISCNCGGDLIVRWGNHGRSAGHNLPVPDESRIYYLCP